MSKHDFSQSNVAAISASILYCRGVVMNYVLPTEAMPYSWDTGVVNTVVTWLEVLQVNSAKDQLERLMQKSDEKLERISQRIGSVDLKAYQSMQDGETTLSSLKEKFSVLAQSSKQSVSHAGAFDALRSSLLTVDEKFNQVDFEKLSEEEKKDYYERLINIPDGKLTEDDKARIQKYIDYLKDKFVIDSNLSEEEKEFIALYEKIHQAEKNNINTFFENSSKDGITENDTLNIKYIAYMSEEPYHKTFFSCIADIKVETWKNDGSLDGEKISHYNRKGCVFLNLNGKDPDGINDKDGSYTTVFHELGHAIDDRLIDWGDIEKNNNGQNVLTFINFYDTLDDIDGFYDTLYSDLRNYLVNLTRFANDEVLPIKLSDESINDIVESFLDGRKRLTLDPIEQSAYMVISTSLTGGLFGVLTGKLGLLNSNGSVSDISGGLTNNTIVGAYGHTGKNYWYDDNGTPSYNQGKEFFAEYMSYAMTGQIDKMNELRKIFPNACKLLDERLSSAANIKTEFDNSSDVGDTMNDLIENGVVK